MNLLTRKNHVFWRVFISDLQWLWNLYLWVPQHFLASTCISLTEYQQIYISTNYKYCLARILIYKLPWMLDNILIICVSPLLFFNSFWHWSYWSLSKISWYRYSQYILIIWLFVPSISEQKSVNLFYISHLGVKMWAVLKSALVIPKRKGQPWS